MDIPSAGDEEAVQPLICLRRLLSVPCTLKGVHGFAKIKDSQDQLKRAHSAPNLSSRVEMIGNELLEREVDNEQSNRIPLDIPKEIQRDQHLSTVKTLNVTNGYVDREEFSLWIDNIPAEKIIQYREIWLQWGREVSRTDGEIGRKMLEKEEQVLASKVGNSTAVTSARQHGDSSLDKCSNRQTSVEKGDYVQNCARELLTPCDEALLEIGCTFPQIKEAKQLLRTQFDAEIDWTASDLFAKIHEMQDGQVGRVVQQISDADAKRKVTCMLCEENEIAFRFGPCMHIVACGECYKKPTRCPVCSKVITKRDAIRLRD